jgi:hypothetical protein
MITSLPPAPVVIQHKPVEQKVKVVVVRPGDTLSELAKKFYGEADRWPALYWDNRGRISNPSLVPAGIRLKVEAFRPLSNWQHAKALSANAYQPKHAAYVPKHAAKPVTVAAAPAAAPSPAPVSTSIPGGFEGCVIQAESGGDPTAYNTSSGASGLFGFLPSTWDSLGLGYPGGAYTAPASVQMQGFSILFARDGTAPWAPYDGC